MKKTLFSPAFSLLTTALLCLPLFLSGCDSGGIEISNVSYDPTREIYKEYNELFAKHWAEQTGQSVRILQSHGGSGRQAKSVINGQRADVVTLALSFDIDLIASKSGLLPEDWQSRLPNNSCPYTSTIVFLVRRGNPKQIKDWEDLTKDGVEIITPDPKTSGGARWNYLAAWGAILKRELGDWSKLRDPEKAAEVEAANETARKFVADLFLNVKSMDAGARGSTQRFVDLQSGDVLLAWENEALLYKTSKPEEGFEVVVPSVTILAEPPVALVDKVVDRQGTREIAEAYLKLLYEPAAQEIVAKNFYRPSDAAVMEKFTDVFPQAELFRVADVFGTWNEIQEKHFNTDAEFDRIIMQNAAR